MGRSYERSRAARPRSPARPPHVALRTPLEPPRGRRIGSTRRRAARRHTRRTAAARRSHARVRARETPPADSARCNALSLPSAAAAARSAEFGMPTGSTTVMPMDMSFSRYLWGRGETHRPAPEPTGDRPARWSGEPRGARRALASRSTPESWRSLHISGRISKRRCGETQRWRPYGSSMPRKHPETT